ncbi:MAG: XRE family transcriptional regulator [Rhizobiales bacterium 24-66-13]|jgi:Zn-dependent peptidase ImmA (M78 family)/DNA-binding XRE family transcriptional regulator|nr:MAG: XRE family transcriptional regulator [Rhizobiales bacterium 35-66-30]OYZ82352.1 MAG: XRE family transcriptional regulator [Rhizobiales bacterium 24-66-13]OZB10716.1 MAG: XRE family transcriptional regulator [Rhizobiales bacterium 39-66-18]HQS46916.1 ImmA/IrrE family metallo-endopeptidase [Xanthobacteraceae bacterium]
MVAKFNPNRLALARQRRRLTGKDLANAAGVSAVTISRLENSGNEPDDITVRKLATALGYPPEFFYAENPEILDTGTVSFRSLSKMSAKERDAAIAAGSLGLELSDWLEKQFSLPAANFIDLSYETDPEAAARALRAYWGLGEQPISNMLGLLEVKGVRVFSLSEATKTVDAFSFWRDERPYVFLNNFKSAEHSIFDSAHELGHLVMHRHAGPQSSRETEREANQFASAFLMPNNDVRSRVPRFITVDIILKAKARWRVSAMAMAYRLHHLGLMSEWQYKSACIELGRRGYRTGEPVGVEREISAIWRKALSHLWHERTTKTEIAALLNIPADELEALIWGLAGSAPRPAIEPGKPTLKVIAR